MIAISARQAFAVLTDSGIAPDQAGKALDSLKPAARFDCAPYHGAPPSQAAKFAVLEGARALGSAALSAQQWSN